MIMRKKYFVVILVSITIVIAGFFYSCAYQGSEGAVLLRADTDEAATVSGKTSKESEINFNVGQKVSKSDNEEPTKQNILQTQTEVGEALGQKIYVHICGAVVEPGVYEVEADTRLNDVLKLSGGLTEDAAGDYMNLAAKVYDGQRIYIPTKKEIAELTPEEYAKGDTSHTDIPVMQETSKQQETLININTAGVTELMELPGIGQAKAESILAYRKEIGQFQKTEELMNIPGIKEGLYRKIASYVTVD